AGENGDTATRANGGVTIGPSYGDLSSVGTQSPSALANLDVRIRNTVTDSYARIKLSDLVASLSASPSTAAGMSMGGRLTLASGTPITESDQIGATTLYLTPYHNDWVTIFDGSGWVLYEYSE